MKTEQPLNMPLARFDSSRALRGSLAATVAFMLLGAAVAFSPARSALAMIKSPHQPMTAARPADIEACVGCHGGNLQGRTGFSPGITRGGILKRYTKTTFRRVMNTGVTPSGKPVDPPMKVYHYSAKVSDAIYNYLKSQK